MKLSIITINYNNASGLNDTIKSVIEQTWNDFEFIIIDGGSTDESVEIIRRYVDKISYWISEPDGGVYNAMNKGIKEANGEYLFMLNSGDYLCNKNVLETVFSANQYNEDILTGDVYRASKGKVFAKSYCPDKLTFNLFRNGSLHHQGTFIKRSLHDTIGMYDEKLKFSSDWKFFVLAICKFNVSYKHLPFFISVCDCEGLTFNPTNFSEMGKEFEQVLKHYFPAFLDDYLNFEKSSRNAVKRQIQQRIYSVKLKMKKIWIKLSYN